MQGNPNLLNIKNEMNSKGSIENKNFIQDKKEVFINFGKAKIKTQITEALKERITNKNLVYSFKKNEITNKSFL